MLLERIGMQICCISQYILYRKTHLHLLPTHSMLCSVSAKTGNCRGIRWKNPDNFLEPRTVAAAKAKSPLCLLVTEGSDGRLSTFRPRAAPKFSPKIESPEPRPQKPLWLPAWEAEINESAACRPGYAACKRVRRRRFLVCIKRAMWKNGYFFFGKTVSFIPLPTRNLSVVLAGI
jgi:hypothetical protein